MLVDSNVLISASTYSVSEELGVPLKHPFFDQCTNLIFLFKKHLTKRIGVITTVIEEEAFSALEKAVKQEIKKEGIDRKITFQTLSIINNSCEDRMRRITSYLLREPIDDHEAAHCYMKVCRMYEKLKQMALESNVQVKAYTKAGHVPPGYQKLAYDIYIEQESVKFHQVMRLIYKTPSDIDNTILAQAIYLLKLYKKTESGKVKLCLASTDTHFSPKRLKGGVESRIITDEIFDQFGIICDWPAQIFSFCSKELG